MTTAIDAISAADVLAGLPKRISKVIAPHIAVRPTDPALVEADRSWSYQELIIRSGFNVYPAEVEFGTERTAFASAKFGLRAVAQAAARELWPKNIHVVHLIIDSGVDTEWVRERIKEREGQAALDNLDPNRLMPPAAVAEAYWQLYQHPRSAWVFEQEIRPFGEKW